MELQHFSHQHPLVFIEEHSPESEKVNCSGCGEMVSGPSFGCMQCKFYLDKQCAEAPSEMRHPFDRGHRFNLAIWHPSRGRALCDFCGKTCENFNYQCYPCDLNLHIECALFSHGIAEKRTSELQDISRRDPSSVDTGNYTEELKKAECIVCGKPLLDSVYLSPDCGFYLHPKCVDLPPQINHLVHQQHPLLLQFNSRQRSCNICQKTQFPGLVYRCEPCNLTLHIKCAENTNTISTKVNKPYHRKHPLVLQIVNETLPCRICQETTNFNDVVYFCSICKFVLHIRCVSSPPIIEDRLHHKHPFSLLRRQVFSSCDACGTSGNYVPYICSTCDLVVHKKCISLPRTIKFSGHQHNISHTYFLEQHDQPKTWECRHCCEEVDAEHGSYFCYKCDYIIHVNCAMKYRGSYIEVQLIEEDETPDSDEPTDAREIVTATWIKHSGHPHNLALSEDTNWEQCDGCLLPISTSCYHCLQCDFFLHKSCAELPLKKHVWFHYHQEPLRLTLEGIFICAVCGCQTSGFVYTCAACEDCVCLRCTLVPDITRCEGHEHLLYWRSGSSGRCNACGRYAESAYRCKTCDFVLHHNCIILPVAARHRFDEHPFKLTYHDADNYSESHRCDICEKERNPEHWFYHCSVCNSSAHTECVVGEYSFIKPGIIYTGGDHHHPHPLTFVRKDHIYPECHICGEYCIDLSVECNTTGCSYIVHWDCVIPPELETPPGLWWNSQSEKSWDTI